MRRLAGLLGAVALLWWLLGADRATPEFAAAAPLSAEAVVTQSCSALFPGRVAVSFSWPRAPAGVSAIWLDLSLSGEDFAPGTFAGVGPLAPTATSYTWDGLSGGLLHYYRVNALSRDGWRQLAVGSFSSGHCSSVNPVVQPIRQECVDGANTGRVRARFGWTPNLHNSGQWLDLSVSDDPFAPGNFVAVGPLPAGISTYTWEGLAPNTAHFWRVNELVGGQWFTSQTGSFVTLPCGIAGPAANPLLLQMQDAMAAIVAESGLDLAVAVTDLQTGETVSVNGDVPRLPGCVANFFTLLTVVADVQAGVYPESWVGDLISRTVYSSNPHTARELVLIAGGGDPAAGVRKVAALVESLGLSNTVYDHPPAYADMFSLYGSENITTANDTNRALLALYRGAVVNPDWRDYLLDKMTGVKPGLNHLTAVVAGYGATVSHKNGFYDKGYVDNDIGIVRFTRGDTTYAYAISLFAQDITTEFADVPWLQQIGALAWQYFSSRYP